MNYTRPKIAIVDANTLSVLGLKQLLQTVMPIMSVDTYGTMTELTANNPEQYMHYFVAMNIVLENRAFFSERRRKTIVLTLSLTSSSQLAEFHSICINVPEDQLVRQLLTLQQMDAERGPHTDQLQDPRGRGGAVRHSELLKSRRIVC